MDLTMRPHPLLVFPCVQWSTFHGVFFYKKLVFYGLFRLKLSSYLKFPSFLRSCSIVSNNTLPMSCNIATLGPCKTFERHNIRICHAASSPTLSLLPWLLQLQLVRTICYGFLIPARDIQFERFIALEVSLKQSY